MSARYARGCSHEGHNHGDEYDFVCVVCGVVVPMCEGGGIWDEAASSAESESHLGVCEPCSNDLDDSHPDAVAASTQDALEIMYPEGR